MFELPYGRSKQYRYHESGEVKVQGTEKRDAARKPRSAAHAGFGEIAQVLTRRQSLGTNCSGYS